MLTLGVTLPLWQKPRRAKIREADAGIAEMQAGVANSRAELRQRIEDAWFRAKASREMITLFDQRLIPDAQQAYELSLQSYSAGKQSFVDVLDTWRLLLKFQLQQEGNRASLGKASASLKSAAAIR
jgi:cobalt-zinc-cadmium efflux system outer membrane protein